MPPLTPITAGFLNQIINIHFSLSTGMLPSSPSFIPMPSDAQLNANRINSKLSTGPKTEEAKTKYSLNAIKQRLHRSRDKDLAVLKQLQDERAQVFAARLQKAAKLSRKMTRERKPFNAQKLALNFQAPKSMRK